MSLWLPFRATCVIALAAHVVSAEPSPRWLEAGSAVRDVDEDGDQLVPKVASRIPRELAEHEFGITAGEDEKEEEEEAEEGEEEHKENENEEGGEEGQKSEVAEELDELDHDEGIEEVSEMDFGIAIMLLGFVAFVMALFWVVNYQDEDIRYYAWMTISNTISIFMSVLMFQAIHFAVFHALERLEASEGVIIATGILTVFILYSAMQIALAAFAGALEETPYVSSTSLEEQIDDRLRLTKCWVSLLAHMSAFATISAGAIMQQNHAVSKNPWVAFTAVPVMYLLLMLVFRLFRQIRIIVINRNLAKLREEMGYKKDEFVSVHEYRAKMSESPEKYGKAFALRTWDMEVFEAENDLAGLSVSFLTVQACRYIITGVLPNAMGVQEDYPHSGGIAILLVGLTLLFACGTVGAVAVFDLFPAEVVPGSFMSLLKRCVAVIRLTMAMCFAWASFYTTKSMMGCLDFLGNPNSLHSRVVVAISLSFGCTCFIVTLDKLADMDCTGPRADMSIFSIIHAMGILVGFAWEQSFDAGSEAIIHKFANQIDPVILQICLATFVACIVITPWSRHILRKVIAGEKAWEHRHKSQDLIAQERGEGTIDEMDPSCVPLTSARPTPHNL